MPEFVQNTSMNRDPSELTIKPVGFFRDHSERLGIDEKLISVLEISVLCRNFAWRPFDIARPIAMLS
jgi:hypothetical protein